MVNLVIISCKGWWCMYIELAQIVKNYVQSRPEEYYFVTSFHGSASSAPACHDVFGKHLHMCVWFPSNMQWLAAALHNRLARAGWLRLCIIVWLVLRRRC